MGTDNITNSIANKLANKEDLTKEEQNIIKEELKIAKIKIFISKLSVAFIIFIQIIFFIYVAYRITVGLTFIAPDSKPKSNHVAVLNIDKPINSKYADRFINDLIHANNDNKVKSIVIRLRSPGGAPAASWNIATMVKDLQAEKKKKIYIYIDSMAASGAYMIASQSDKIYTNRFAIVGSIGVILEHIVIKDLAKKIGIGQETLTAGKYKKMISMFDYLSVEDRKRIQDTLLNVMYDNFLSTVAEGRNLDISKFDNFAEGRVFVGNDKSIKGILIDEVIDWPDFKRLVVKENKFKKDILFSPYKNSTPNFSFKEFIGSSLNMNVNLNIDSENESIKLK